MFQLNLFDSYSNAKAPSNPTLDREILEGDVVDPLALELAVEDALFRIRRDYERTGGQIYLSFSGGKDSTVLAHLIMMADLPTPIPFVFSDTGIEMGATTRFVQTFPYENIQYVKPKKPFAQILKQYGKPALAKLKSEALSTYQKNDRNPYSTARAFQMVTGHRIKDWKLVGGRNSYTLAQKDLHFLHEDTEIKFANKCCHYLKKEPFARFEKEHQMKGSFSGTRVDEGGARSMAIKSCVTIKKKRGQAFIASTPIFDWTDEILNQFIRQYGIELSEAYTVYGLTRTGCMGCPFSKNLTHELKALYDYEPNRYKAAMHWMKDVYLYQGVKCDFDPTYMQDYHRMQPIIEKRRLSMIQKFKNPLKQKFFALFCGSDKSKREAEREQLVYDERLPLSHLPEVYEVFSRHYVDVLKPLWNKHNHVQFIYRRFTLELEASFLDAWKQELPTLPDFYREILAGEVESFC